MSSTESQAASATRSITELIIRSVAIHLFALANYGHMGSLMKLPKNLHTLYVVVFFFYPAIILGQIVYGLCAAALYKLAQNERDSSSEADFSFCIQGIVGVHALPNGIMSDHALADMSAIPLFKAEHLSLQRTRYRVSWKWFGRVGVCLVAVTQAIGTFVLFIRRMNHPINWPEEEIAIDVLNGVTAFSSAAAGIVALVILLMRLEWQVIDDHRPVETETLEHRLAALGIQLVVAFLCVGWIRGYMFWYLLYGYVWVFGTDHPFAIVVIGAFVCIFRQDIAQRIGVARLRRISTLLLYLGVVIVLDDIVMSIVTCVIELTEMKNAGWKDPLSDMLLVV